MDTFIVQQRPYDTLGLDLEQAEREVFVDKEGQCHVFETKDNQFAVTFAKPEMRTSLVQQYLAYWSRAIQSEFERLAAESDDTYVVLIEFRGGDRQVAQAATHAQQHQSCLQVVKQSDVESRFDNLNLDKVRDDLKDAVTVVVRVAVEGVVDETLDIKCMQMIPLQLFCQVPVLRQLYDGRFVWLTMLEQGIFLRPEYRVTFYQHDDLWEPVLLDQEVRAALIKRAIQEVAPTFQDDARLYKITVPGGDRQLLYLGGLVAQKDGNSGLQVANLDDFKESEKLHADLTKRLNQLETLDSAQTFILLVVSVMKPESDELLSNTVVAIQKSNKTTA